MNNINIVPYTSRVWNEDILNYLNVDSEGRVVTAETWQALWSLNFNFINIVDTHLTNLVGAQGVLATLAEEHNTLIAEHAQIIADYNTLQLKFNILDEAIDAAHNAASIAETHAKACQELFDSLSSSFVHYGALPPSNPQILFWIVPATLEYPDDSLGVFITPAENISYNGYKYNAKEVKSTLDGVLNDLINLTSHALTDQQVVDNIPDQISEHGPIQIPSVKAVKLHVFDKVDEEINNALQTRVYDIAYSNEMIPHVVSVGDALDIIFSNGGNTIAVDQKYSPSSPNAQSGTAVAEAINPVQAQANNAFGLAQYVASTASRNEQNIAILQQDVGDIDDALDAIIEIQNSLIGGAE